MKPFPLLPQLALVFAVAYACTDSMAPANSHALLTPGNPTFAPVPGDPPPPPVDAAINVCTVAGCALYDGTYFSNGETLASAVAANEVGDLSLTFDGTSWLKFDQKQLTPFGTASANARFKRQDDKLTGVGTLMINFQKVVITDVVEFIPFENCGQPGDPCAVIVFKYLLNDGDEELDGTANAESIEGCEFIPPDGSGGGFFSCPGEEG